MQWRVNNGTSVSAEYDLFTFDNLSDCNDFDSVHAHRDKDAESSAIFSIAVFRHSTTLQILHSSIL